MKQLVLNIVFFLILGQGLLAQDWTLSIQSFQGIDASFQNPIRFNHFGGTLDFGYEIRNLDLSSNVSLRSIDWGNQISFGQSISFGLLERDQWRLKNKNGFCVNFPLYYNKRSFGYGLSSGLEFSGSALKGFVIYYGLTYNHLAEYLEWSRRKLILEGAFSIGWKF